MKIAIDIMGFEGDQYNVFKAGTLFLKQHKDVQLIFVGKVQSTLSKKIYHFLKQKRIELYETDDFIKMTDLPITALRKKTTSMYNAINLVKNQKADAIISAGSTSCFVPLVYKILGLVGNLTKFAFMPSIPTINMRTTNLLDCGANINCTGKDLYNFALMANAYNKIVKKISNPRIGLLNIGTEEHKGFAFHHEADKLLKTDKNLNYLGFCEPNKILSGQYDIILSDGYSGNLSLKAVEGSLKTISKCLKTNYAKPINWLGFICSINTIFSIKKTFNHKNNSAAIVLGANGIAIKTHGAAGMESFYSALCIAFFCIKNNIVDSINKINYA